MTKLLLLCLIVMVAVAAHPKNDRAPKEEHRQQVPHATNAHGASFDEPVYPAFSTEEMRRTKDMLDKHNG